MLDSGAMRILAPAIAIPVIFVLLYLFEPGVRELPWTTLRIAGGILAIIGYVLLITARVQLGKSFAVEPEAKELVTHGLYSRLRNPMYIFVDLMFFGLILVLEWPWVLILLAMFIIFHIRQAGLEANVLREKFGQSYLDYRKQTWF